MWLVPNSNLQPRTTVKIRLEDKNNWNLFIEKNISLYKHMGLMEILNHFENNIFMDINKANRHYAKIVLCSLKEHNKDINVNIQQDFYLFEYDPIKILLSPHLEKYLIVKEAAEFIKEFDKSIPIDLNNISNLIVAHPRLQTDEYKNFLKQSQDVFVEILKELQEIEVALKTMTSEIQLEVNIDTLLRWQLIDNIYKQPEIFSIFSSLIDQGVLLPNMLIKYSKTDVHFTFFEYLLMKPLKENIELAKDLFIKHQEFFNIEETYNIFKVKVEKIESSFNKNKSSFSPEYHNLYDMVKFLEIHYLNMKLQEELIEKESGTQGKGKGKIKI